jgi:hypothetical protein
MIQKVTASPIECTPDTPFCITDIGTEDMLWLFRLMMKYSKVDIAVASSTAQSESTSALADEDHNDLAQYY